MPSRSNPKPSREWELENMEHHDAAIREVLLIALRKYENGEDPVILTTDEVNEEVVRKGLRDSELLQGKKKGSIIGAYRKRETLSNLSPRLFIPVTSGTYRFNPYYLEKLKEFGDRWRFGEPTPVSPQASRISQVQEYLGSLHKDFSRLSAKLETITEQVRTLLAEEARELSFVHTSPDFHDSAYGAKVTSIKDTIEAMLQRAEHSIRISTLRIDIVADQLIRLKQNNPDLEITVLTRGRSDTQGERKGIGRRAHDRMSKVDIKMLAEKELLHSRMVVIDEQEVLVSSADLDVTQMELEFNAGIWTNDPDVVAEAIRYFDNLISFK